MDKRNNRPRKISKYLEENCLLNLQKQGGLSCVKLKLSFSYILNNAEAAYFTLVCLFLAALRNQLQGGLSEIYFSQPRWKGVWLSLEMNDNPVT